MASPFAYYNLPSENLIAGLTPTVDDGTVDTDYGVANLTTTNPARPCKFTTTHFRLTWDLGSAKQFQLALVVHGNFAGGTLTLQANSSNAWGSPTYSSAFTLSTVDADGYYDNLVQTVNQTYRYVSLVCTGNSANCVLGNLWLGSSLRQFTHGWQRSRQMVDRRRALVSETVAGVQAVYDLGSREQAVRNLVFVTDRTTGFAALRTLWRAARGRTLAWPIILDPTRTDSVGGELVRFDQDELVATSLSPEAVQVQVTLRTVSRGPSL